MCVMLLGLVAACATPSSNLQGKSFDADSEYCRQLWKTATTVYQRNPDLPIIKARATNPDLAALRPVQQISLHSSRQAYDTDCESLAAYNERAKRESF